MTPAPVGFPGARLAARWETGVRRQGKWSREEVPLLSSHPLEQLQAQGLLVLPRDDWGVESRRHHCLAITLREEESRVRTPNAARIWGTIRRGVVSRANAAGDRGRAQKPKPKPTPRTFPPRFRSARGGGERLQALLFAKRPDVLD